MNSLEFEPNGIDDRENLQEFLTSENLEAITTEVVESTKLQEWAEAKFQKKFEAKDTAMAGDDNTNEFAEWKCLGDLFLLNENSFSPEAQKILQRNGIDVYADEVAELHIPTNDISVSKVRNSLRRLSEYVQSDERNTGRSPLKFIYGVTFLPAERFGFTKVELPQSAQDFAAAARVLESVKISTNTQIQKLETKIEAYVPDATNQKVTTIIKGEDETLVNMQQKLRRLKARKNTLEKYSQSDIALYYLSVDELADPKPSDKV